MRCEIDRELLHEVLRNIQAVLPPRSSSQLAQNNARIEVRDNRLTLLVTDLDIFLETTLSLEQAGEDGIVVVNARKLAEIIGALETPRVSFYTKENNLHLETSVVRTVFTCANPADFPPPRQLPEGTSFEFPLATMHELYEACGFAVSKDETRPAISGINWEITKSEARMVGTDGHRLAFVARRGKYPCKFRAILPPKLFALLPKVGETVVISADPANVAMKVGGTLITCRQIEGPYPDYERVIPKGYPARAVFVRDTLIAVLRRAAVFAQPLGQPVAFEFRHKKLTIRSENRDLGRFEEATECDYNGEDLRIWFNVSFLIDALRRLESNKVLFELSTPMSAGVLKRAEPEPDTDRVYLMMPIRLD